MARILQTGDENAGQVMDVPVPGRSSPLKVQVGASVGPASDCVPWSNTWFVDPGTTVPLLDQTGSPCTPFATAQQAVDAAASGDAIVLGQGNGGDVTTDKSVAFLGLAGSLNGLTESQLGNIVTTEFVTLTNIQVVSIQGSVVTLNGCHVEPGGISCASLVASETTFVFGDEQIACSDDGATLRDCTFDVTGEVNPLYTGEAPSFDLVSARSFQSTGSWQVDAGTSVQIPQDLEPNEYYGDGSDGTVAVVGTVTLTRDMYYANLTFDTDGTANLVPNGFKIFCSGLCDLRNAPAGAIDWVGQAGANAVGQTGGVASGPFTSGSLGTGGSGNAGGKGGAIGAAGAAGGASDGTVRGYTGGIGGSGGDGGASTGAAGKGGVQTAGPVFRAVPTRLASLAYGTALSLSGTLPRGGGPSAGGGGGGGGADVGGGGGGGAVGAWSGLLQARVITRDSTTNAAALRCAGHIGGTGGNAGAGGGAGGGGGGGEGATGIMIVCDWLLGEPDACISLNGGTGGTGGNGTGGAAGGTGGRGGDGGQVLTLQRLRASGSSVTVQTGTAGSNGSGPAGSVGGAGGAGGTLVGTL